MVAGSPLPGQTNLASRTGVDGAPGGAGVPYLLTSPDQRGPPALWPSGCLPTVRRVVARRALPHVPRRCGVDRGCILRIVMRLVSAHSPQVTRNRENCRDEDRPVS